MKTDFTNIKDQGSLSEWNEGNFKNLRLHEAQELINLGKLNPLIKTNGSWNFELWISGITVLYGEGQSKYSDVEISDIENIKEVVLKILSLKPPVFIATTSGINTSKIKEKIDYKNWEDLRKMIEFYEQKVKRYNDIHGLSTRNFDYDDEGL